MCGCANVRMWGYADVRICGCADVRMWGGSNALSYTVHRTSYTVTPCTALCLTFGDFYLK